MKPITLQSNAAMTLARHMNMDTRFDMAESATFYFFGLKIVVTKQPDDVIDLASERQDAFENQDEIDSECR